MVTYQCQKWDPHAILGLEIMFYKNISPRRVLGTHILITGSISGIMLVTDNGRDSHMLPFGHQMATHAAVYQYRKSQKAIHEAI